MRKISFYAVIILAILASSTLIQWTALTTPTLIQPTAATEPKCYEGKDVLILYIKIVSTTAMNNMVKNQLTVSRALS
ncbi:MAG: hypothetical protein J7L38_07795 [Thermoproteales archaeon]|nr:hypothetical protein [Thermoproteales archaeon]